MNFKFSIESITFALSVWGSGLATILSIFQIWDKWNARFRIATSYSFTGLESEGNSIAIYNLSPYSVTMTYWKLFYKKRVSFFRNKSSIIQESDGDLTGTCIPSKQHVVLTFADEEHFHWGENSGDVILVMHFAGINKSISKTVFKNGFK